MLNNHLRLLHTLFINLWQFNKKQTLTAIFLITAQSISTGFGLFLILPFLNAVGLLSQNVQTNSMLYQSLQQVQTVMPFNSPLANVLSLYALISATVAIIMYAEKIISGQLKQGYSTHLRNQLHKAIILLKWPYFIEHKSSDLLHSLTKKIDNIAAANYLLLVLINNTIFIIIYTLYACHLSISATLLACVFGCFLLLMVKPWQKKTSKNAKAYQADNQNLFQILNEEFLMIKGIKASNLSNKANQHLKKINHQVEKKGFLLTKNMAMAKLSYSLLAILTLTLLILVCENIIALPAAKLLMLLIIFSRILPLVSSCQQNYQSVLHFLPSVADVESLLKNCQKHAEKNKSTADTIHFQEKITFQKITFSYQPKKTPLIFENFTSEIPKNKITIITGPSGMGKSTLIDLLTGLFLPTNGQIIIDNTVLTEKNITAWRKNIVYLTQESFLFNGTLRENLCFYNKNLSDNALWQVIDKVEAHFCYDLKNGLNTRLGDRGLYFSGGEKQRLILARALLMKPKLLILDESTNALDDKTLVSLKKLLKTLKSTLTLVIISHQNSLIDIADNIIDLAKKKEYQPHGRVEKRRQKLCATKSFYPCETE